MGIIITSSSKKRTEPPFGVVVILECDAVTEFFCRGYEQFEHEDGFAGAHQAAMEAGWLERQGPRGREWLCPTCSGK
jgi:hypothetical protein